MNRYEGDAPRDPTAAYDERQRADAEYPSEHARGGGRHGEWEQQQPDVGYYPHPSHEAALQQSHEELAASGAFYATNLEFYDEGGAGRRVYTDSDFALVRCTE